MFSKYANIFGLIGLGVGLVQIIMEFIKQVEQSPGFGAEKKQLVINMIKLVWPTLQKSVKELQAIDWAVLEPIIGQAVDQIVNFFNVVGIFKHVADASAS
jgi:hypothetical protein